MHFELDRQQSRGVGPDGPPGDKFGRVGNDITKEFGLFDLNISPSGVYLVVVPWMLVWPDTAWYLLEVKRKEKYKTDLPSDWIWHGNTSKRNWNQQKNIRGLYSGDVGSIDCITMGGKNKTR